ncbi:MAG: hypothetical protein H6Q73_1239 [Firmicutes bacterium]|nr:hypothetical protein [Bacillota bacterium]
MWTVVYIATNRTQAEAMKKLLSDEGILANIRPAGVSMQGDGMCELMVLESEADEAHAILYQLVVR